MNRVAMTRQKQVRRVWVRQLPLILSVIGPELITANVEMDAQRSRLLARRCNLRVTASCGRLYWLLTQSCRCARDGCTHGRCHR